MINDRIDEVTATDGWIERVAGSDGSYDADLYIDASGFRRMLMDELEVPMREFDLPVDSAVVATTDLPLSDIESATIVTSGEAGWFWQIDTVDVRDLGYVPSDHVSDDDVAEFLETRPEEIDPDEIRRYRFESGVLESPWKGNCLAVGNAVGFVEPLQSAALTTSARLADRLATFLGMHGRVSHQGSGSCSARRRSRPGRIYDFVSLYYKYNSGMTAFWEDAREVNPVRSSRSAPTGRRDSVPPDAGDADADRNGPEQLLPATISS